MGIRKFFLLHFLFSISLMFQQTHSTLTTAPLTANATATHLIKRLGTWVIGCTGTAEEDPIIYYTSPATGVAENLNSTEVTGDANTHITHLATCDRTDRDNSKIRIIYTKDNGTDEVKKILHRTILNSDNIQQITPKDSIEADNNGIVALATDGYSKIFVALAPGGGNWGDLNSGIALLNITNDDNSDMTYIGGNDGQQGKAMGLAPNHTQIKALGGNPTIAGNPVMTWSSDLGILYVGLTGTTANAEGDSLRTIAVFKLNDTQDRFARIPLLNNNFDTPLLNATDGDDVTSNNSNIIGCTNGAAVKEISFFVSKLDTMHTNTGHNYLIVQGGLGTPDGVNSNRIYALPLVDKTGDVPGTLAYVHNANGPTPQVRFSKTAIDNTKLFTETLDNAPTRATVGGAPVPVEPSLGAIQDMMVVGDTVYCSLLKTEQGPQNSTNIPGIYYSHADFDHTGAIVGWTHWVQALPIETTGSSPSNGSCSFFAVDAINGKIWMIPYYSKNNVRVSSWVRSSSQDSITNSINALLAGPCYSQFNLDKTNYNYAMHQATQLSFFGGNSKVVVVATGAAQNFPEEDIPDNKARILPTTNWTNATVKAVDISRGLENVGAINVLECNAQDNRNPFHNLYLLAGTNQGLYAFVRTTDNAGIDIANGATYTNNFVQFADNVPFTTNAAPFDGSYSWKKIEAIGNDPVVAIITMPNYGISYTFVLTHGATHKIWYFNTEDAETLDILNASVLLDYEASSLSTTGGKHSLFYDITRIACSSEINNMITTSKLLVATNTGLYIRDGENNYVRFDLAIECNEIRSFFNQRHVFNNQTIYYVRQALRQAPGGGWAPAVTSSLGQISFAVNPSTTDASEYYQALSGDRIARGNIPLGLSIKNFFTDGGRRFYIEQVESDSKNGCTLHTVPFYSDAAHYNITEVDDLADSVVDSANTFYWVNNIGAGYLMAGTDNGVIALQ